MLVEAGERQRTISRRQVAEPEQRQIVRDR